MKRLDKAILTSLLVWPEVAAGAVLFTRSGADYRNRLHLKSRRASQPVDMRPLETAQQLAQLAVTHTGQDYAQQALRLADDSVDLALAAAVDEAAENPPQLDPRMRSLVARIQNGQAALAADQHRIIQFTAALAHAPENAKDDLQQLVAIAQAQLALDQDDLQDAQQQLIAAGGDKQAIIQQLLDQHKASALQGTAIEVGTPAATSAIELTHAQNIVAEYRAWASLHAKESSLEQAEQQALAPPPLFPRSTTRSKNNLRKETSRLPLPERRQSRHWRFCSARPWPRKLSLVSALASKPNNSWPVSMPTGPIS
jgi:hypothetical protein